MQADLDRRHQRDAATLEAKKELAALKLLDRSLCDEIDELEVDGVLPRKILEVLKPKIDRARVLAAALAAERKRNAPK